ncbi:MAG: aspartate ammonia-lyase [Chloroflexota bacterium]
MEERIEHDSLGERAVPAEALYGIQSLRAAENFPLTGQRIHPELIRALAEVKQAAALANVRTGLLDKRIGEAIVSAAVEVARGNHHEQFIVDPLQGGAGTSTNMNANEVIANIAIGMLGGERGDYFLVHPLDHVNLSQSTNDVHPTALRIACLRLLAEASAAFAELQAALQEKEAQFAGVLKVGRTELQDAVPVTLGQEFSAWAQAVARDRWRLYKAEERLRQVNLGGTAVGTGLNAERRYTFLVIEKLREITGLGLARAENTIDVTQNADVFAEVSGFLKSAAVNLAKIAADLRLLSSGPRAGLGEIRLPDLQPGSSTMPGKVNPVATEALTQVAYQVMAHDLAVTLAAQAGQLELNAFLPLIAHNLLHAIQLLANGTRMFTARCIRGIAADEARCADNLEASLATVTALVPHLGYERAAAVAIQALRTGQTVRQVVEVEGLMERDRLELALSAGELTKPGIAGAGIKRPEPRGARGDAPPLDADVPRGAEGSART